MGASVARPQLGLRRGADTREHAWCQPGRAASARPALWRAPALRSCHGQPFSHPTVLGLRVNPKTLTPNQGQSLRRTACQGLKLQVVVRAPGRDLLFLVWSYIANMLLVFGALWGLQAGPLPFDALAIWWCLLQFQVVRLIMNGIRLLTRRSPLRATEPLQSAGRALA